MGSYLEALLIGLCLKSAASAGRASAQSVLLDRATDIQRQVRSRSRDGHDESHTIPLRAQGTRLRPYFY